MKFGFISRNVMPGLEQDVVFAAEHGLEGLEFNYWRPFEELTAGMVTKMRAILDKHGVRASALGLWGWNPISPDEAERAESLGHLSRAIEFAEILGAGILITGGGENKDASLEEKVAEFTRVFPPFVERAEKAGLKIALYPMHGNSFFNGLEAYERVWEKVPEVGIKFDPANISLHGDDYLVWLRKHAKRIFHVHIKEHLYMDGEVVAQPAAGMGDIHWGKVMAFLHESDYDGYLSIEPHGPIWSRAPRHHTMVLLSKRHLEQFLV